MKPRPFIRPALVGTLLAAFAAAEAHAQNRFYKNNGETLTLVNMGAWEFENGDPMTLPLASGVSGAPNQATTTTDEWIWDQRVTGADMPDMVQNLTVGNDTGLRKLIFKNPAVPVVIDGGGTRTITMTSVSTSTDPAFLDSGYGGIDMSEATQDLTLQNLNSGANLGLRLGAGGQTFVFNVAAGRTLTINAPVAMRSGASNGIVKFTGAGRVVIAGEFRPSHAVINAGEVEFTRPAGNSRIATASPNPPSYTQVNGGTLWVSNTSGSATGNSAVTLNSTATLGGQGTLSGVVTAESGSTITPGRGGVGTLNFGSLTLKSGSAIVWEANNSAEADALNVTAANGLTINGGTVRLYQPGTTQPFAGTGSFKLIGFNGAIQGAGVDALTIDPTTKIDDGRIYTLVQGANEITLQIVTEAVPTRAWNINANGNWSNAANWTGATVPNAPGAVAHLSGPTGAAFTAPRTITIDSPQTVGTLLVDSTHPVTLSGTAPLSFDAAGATANLTANGADHLVATPVTLAGGSLLATVETGRTLTLAGVVDGVGFGLAKLGPGTLLLTADHTYTGTTTHAAGLLQIGSGGTTGSVAGPIANTATLRFDRAGSLTLAGPISGTGSVEFAGTGDITLPHPNTYSGSTTLSAGTLVLANQNALQNTTLTYTQSGGAAVIAAPLSTVTLGALAGDRPFPVLNTELSPIALVVGGNNASTTYSASSSSSGFSLTKNGTGTFTLAGTHTFTQNLLVNNGVLSLDSGSALNVAAASLGTGSTARILVNGGTLTASASSAVTNNTGGIVVAGGVANFNGGITNPYAETLNALIHVTGGELNATTLSLGRGNLNNSAEEPPGSGQTTSGLYINGGTVNISEALNIGIATNSSATARIDSGTLNSAGPITIGLNNAARWSTLDVNGGTLNSTHESGILLGGPSAGRSVMHVRAASAVVNTPRIQFGQGALAGRAILSQAAGALYVGAGGLALGSTDATFIAQIRLNGGTLGATADWSSTIPVVLAGDVQLTGASSTDQPYTIRLQGPVSGIGALTKTGAGTVILDNPANNFFGPANIQSGRLELAGSTTADFTVSAGATLAPRGTLFADFGAVINGRLAIRYDRTAETPVARLQSNYGITIGSGATLAFEGTGSLTEPAYVIIKAGFGINGTFATVTGLPAGYTLDYNYLEEGATVPSVAIVGGGTLSPFEQWLETNALTGDQANRTADPDADGLVNLMEYALGTSPVVATAATDAYTLGRSGNFLTLGFDQPGDPTLVYTVEATNDLATGTWTTVHTFPGFTAASAALYTDTANLATTPRRFLRLRVSFAP